MEITRLSPDGTLDKSALFDPPTMTFWHDNALTDKYVVAVSSPFVASTARIFKALLGFSTIGLAFKWDENVKPEVKKNTCQTLGSERACEFRYALGLSKPQLRCIFFECVFTSRSRWLDRAGDKSCALRDLRHSKRNIIKLSRPIISKTFQSYKPFQRSVHIHLSRRDSVRFTKSDGLLHGRTAELSY